MNIAVIGGGFTGLTAAYELAKEGHTVTVFERDAFLGGLAHGIQKPEWDWSLEKAYHHLFTNDEAIISLIWELGIPHVLSKHRPITATYWNGGMYPLDSASTLLSFPAMPLIDRIRTGILIAFMKINPFWQPLEHVTASTLFKRVGGHSGWQTIWEPLMTGKFGPYSDAVAASWLWARIKKRTPSLYYINGGFSAVIDQLADAIRVLGGHIQTEASVTSIKTVGKKHTLTVHQADKKAPQTLHVDAVLLTTPTPIALTLLPQLSDEYKENLKTIPHLHAHVVILETDTPLLPDNIYWLNVTDRSFPFLAVVTHTNMVNPRHYANTHLTYVGNYLPVGHPLLSMKKEDVLKLYQPFLKKLRHGKSFRITDSSLFVGPHAQPVHEKKYSQKAPKMATTISGVFLANLDSVYPWDRGTNYAVELGKKAAKTILNSFST